MSPAQTEILDTLAGMERLFPEWRGLWQRSSSVRPLVHGELARLYGLKIDREIVAVYFWFQWKDRACAPQPCISARLHACFGLAAIC